MRSAMGTKRLDVFFDKLFEEIYFLIVETNLFVESLELGMIFLIVVDHAFCTSIVEL